MEAESLADLQRAVAQSWNVTAVSPEWTAILAALTDRVSYLLRHEYARLVTAMYTLDVSEQRFNAAQAGEDPAREIAKLILEREQEKIASRRAYERSRERSTDQPRINTDKHG